MPSSIQDLARQAFEAGAIDLFLCEGEPPRMRIQDQVNALEEAPLEHSALVDFWKACGANPEEDLERDVSHVIPGGRRLRVNLYRSLGSLAAVSKPPRRR